MTARFILGFMAVCVLGCGTSVSTGPAPAAGYNHTHVKYDDSSPHEKNDVQIGESLLDPQNSSVTLAAPVKTKHGQLLSFQGKIVGVTDETWPQFVAIECSRETTVGSIITSSGVINCKRENDSVTYCIDIPSPSLAGNHKFIIKAIRALKTDGSVVPEGAETTTIVARGTVDVVDGTLDPMSIAPEPDPSFKIDRTPNAKLQDKQVPAGGQSSN